MAYSTSRIEFLVAIPISMIRPISEGIEKTSARSAGHEGAAQRQRQRARMVTGCRKSLNSSTSTM
jgi:hypothetical protein